MMFVMLRGFPTRVYMESQTTPRQRAVIYIFTTLVPGARSISEVYFRDYHITAARTVLRLTFNGGR